MESGLTKGLHLGYIEVMGSTTKPAPGTAELVALRNRLVKEATRIEHLLHEVEQALSGGQDSKPATAKNDPLPPKPSPLDAIKQILDATADLRTRDGNISADRIAALYGISLSQLANWLGKSRQAVTKTPDADSLQPALACFERVARLRAVVKIDDAFRKWLRTDSDLLDGKKPLELLAKGEGQVVADLVDDMLTGAPSGVVIE